MGKIFVTSDCHFDNPTVHTYFHRPFANMLEQTTELITRWNSVVGETDTVIVCGDFIDELSSIPTILRQLNGTIILTRGNHDSTEMLETYKQYPEKIIVKDIHYESFRGLFFVFNHFPMTNREFMNMVGDHRSEVVFCHGHVHNMIKFFNKRNHCFNCSVEVTDYTPVSLESMFQLIRQDFISHNAWKGE